jgi:hypothetical protein
MAQGDENRKGAVKSAPTNVGRDSSFADAKKIYESVL